jgi:hypothetical protein
VLKESNRVFIKIPFNVWEKCGQKGLIPVEVEVLGINFECKLVPKGNGIYYIPVIKEIYKNIAFDEEIDTKFKIISGLSRINSYSPYSKENPIRKIDGITYLRQPHNGCCGQACLAMLAGISVDEVIKIMKSTKWQVSLSKVIETLDYFGFTHKKPIYTKGRKVELPKCCIVNVRGESKSHLLIYYDAKYYDPTHGVLQEYACENIISYIEIS